MPDAPGGRRKAPTRLARHFIVAVLNLALVVSMPFVLKIGPLPEVFGAGMAMPFWRRHVAYLVSAVLKAGLLTRRKPVPPLRPERAPKLLPPHFFRAASNWALVIPFGNAGPPPPPGNPPPGTPEPGVRWGSVTPFFCRHSRIAPKRPRLDPAAVLWVEDPLVEVVPVDPPAAEPVVEAAVAAAFEELPDEPPQAPKPRQASTRIANTPAARLRTAARGLL